MSAECMRDGALIVFAANEQFTAEDSLRWDLEGAPIGRHGGAHIQSPIATRKR